MSGWQDALQALQTQVQGDPQLVGKLQLLQDLLSSRCVLGHPVVLKLPVLLLLSHWGFAGRV